jgi:hypothetical protein
MTSDNQPLFTSWRSSGDFLLGLYCVAWLTQESVSSRIFVRKKGMSHISPTDVHSRRLPQGSERRKRACSAATTRFHERLAFEKPLRSEPETWGRMYKVPTLRN